MKGYSRESQEKQTCAAGRKNNVRDLIYIHIFNLFLQLNKVLN